MATLDNQRVDLFHFQAYLWDDCSTSEYCWCGRKTREFTRFLGDKYTQQRFLGRHHILWPIDSIDHLLEFNWTSSETGQSGMNLQFGLVSHSIIPSTGEPSLSPKAGNPIRSMRLLDKLIYFTMVSCTCSTKKCVHSCFWFKSLAFRLPKPGDFSKHQKPSSGRLWPSLESERGNRCGWGSLELTWDVEMLFPRSAWCLASGKSPGNNWERIRS
jgi:hypothetical protein